MTFLQRNRFGLKHVGQTANVPNNDVAKLMYYFSCVCSAVECDTTPQMRRLANYSNYMHMSINDIRLLIVLCYRFSPDVFEDKVFFQSDALCGNSSNKFYEISQVSHNVLAVSSIVIAGQTQRVKQIMTYKRSWMVNNYMEPMLRLAQRFGG